MPDSTATNAASYTTPWDTILLRSGLSARKLLDIFKKEQPIIAIACQALEFDRVFQQLFEEGILFGKAAKFADGYAINGPTARPNFDRFPATTWEVILYSQRQERPERSPQIGYALMTGYPVFALAETPDQFPEELERFPINLDHIRTS